MNTVIKGILRRLALLEKRPSGGGTVISGGPGVTSVSTTAPITGGPITTTGTIGITQATTSTDGYLSSTDWNTFNNKQTTGLSWLLASGGTLTGDNFIDGNYGIGFGSPVNSLNKIKIRGFGVGTGKGILFEDNNGVERFSVTDGGNVLIDRGSGGSGPALKIVQRAQGNFGLQLFESATQRLSVYMSNSNNFFIDANVSSVFNIRTTTTTGNMALTTARQLTISTTNGQWPIILDNALSDNINPDGKVRIQGAANIAGGNTAFTRILGSFVNISLSAGSGEALFINPTYNFTGSGGNTVYGLKYESIKTSLRSFDTEYGFVFTSGNCAVGTTTPTATFQIKSYGTTTGKAFLIQDSVGTNLFEILDNNSIGLYGVTPTARATTAIAEATYVKPTGAFAIHTDDTFGGYTVAQIAQALINIGILT